MADWSHLQVSDGIRQEHRLPRGLQDGYFRIDERGFEDMLAWVAAMSKRLRFVTPDNQDSGFWQELFARQDLAVMAQILATRMEPLEREFHDLLERQPMLAHRQAMDLVHRIDRWLKGLAGQSARPAVELHRRMANLVSGALGADVAKILSLAPGADVDLSPTWRIGERRLSGGGSGEMIDPRPLIRGTFSSLLSGIAFLQSIVPTYFKDSLDDSHHEPAFALVLAFLQLHGDVQGKLNGFTRRHNDFYYRDVLGAAPRGAEPETVQLAFPAAAGAMAASVPRGTVVLGRPPDGAAPIPFRADADTFASAMRVGALHTLYFERDPLISPMREMGFVTRIMTGRLRVDPPTDTEPPSWALFGYDAAGAEHSHPAAMGLAITSPTLLLREGQRRIELRLHLRPPAAVSRINQSMWTKWKEGGDAAEEVWHQLFLEWLRADPQLHAACCLGTDEETLVEQMLQKVPPDERLLFPLAYEETAEIDVYVGFVRCLLAVADRHKKDEQLTREQKTKAFSVPFGRMMAHLLLGPDCTLPDGLVREIIEIGGPLFRDSDDADDSERAAREAIWRLLTERRAYQYEKYLRGGFTLDLSTAEGWHRIENLGVAPLVAGGRDSEAGYSFAGAIGLLLTCELDSDAPAIEPDPEAAAANPGRPPAPAARITLTPGATMCAYSLLAPFVLSEVEVSVSVRGLRDISAYSETGPVDPSKPFLPFGPIPKIGSRFVVGAYEAALKRVEKLRLRLQWSGLPADFGGFSGYYHAYDGEWGQRPFSVDLGWLTAGRWASASPGAAPLFAPVGATEALPERHAISLDVPASASPLTPATPRQAFGFDLTTQGGFASLTLRGPEAAFGHGIYPALFADRMRRRFRLKEPPPLNPPYTPTLSGLLLDYEARTIIRIGKVTPRLARERAEFVDHIGPFGSDEIHPEGRDIEPGALPRRESDGALLIGLGGTGPGKPVTLLFTMAERARRRRSFATPETEWYYLARSGWRPLDPGLILADTTSGMMRSGVVTITLPNDAHVGGEPGGGIAMPYAGIWLRLATDADVQVFPRVGRITANGLTASRQIEEGDDIEFQPLPQNMGWQLRSALAGVGTLAEIRPPQGGQPPEPGERFRARVSERLRHRGRAVAAWDYERLVLDRFPQVERVKCFPVTDDDRPDSPASGRVLVVVVPQPAGVHRERLGEQRMLDALSLNRIRQALSEVAPFGAQIEVRNPAYDMIQVRCKVRFADNTDSGLLLRNLTEDIAAYLSPWDDRGQKLGFGWQLSSADVLAYIQDLAYVEHASEFALLMRSADDNQNFTLTDTARPSLERGRPEAMSFHGLRYTVPWSLPLPLHWQAVQAVQTDVRRSAVGAGIGALRVGSTFVVAGSRKKWQR